MNPVRQDVYPEYKDCAGKGCTNKGKYYLRIQFIHKSGWFCDSCKRILLNNELLDEANEKLGYRDENNGNIRIA